ncbi:hypothetical protein HJ588_14845 [Flexivirga sp. ID2601S]|uniref:Uncharacterized protein n=1 Tax=Flexivirga aerilata TaxID=1656889 RepID=A0A849AKH6_9MICO|nr:hypothetical protein [Flexivirga aerilata]NNG40543.1 hypothetical protein [Flexivirga aerilata]
MHALHAFSPLLQFLAVFAMFALTRYAFSTKAPATRGTLTWAAVMVALAFTPAGWVVHVGMAIGLFAVVEFLFRPLYKVRVQLARSAGFVAALCAAAMLNGQYPWVVFPLAAAVALWFLTGGPARNERKRIRAMQQGAPVGPMQQGSMTQVPVAQGPAPWRGAPAGGSQLSSYLASYLVDPRLPDEARAQLGTLDAESRNALAYLHAHSDNALLIFEIEQIRNDFAPSAVQGYLALPPGLADTEPLQDGRTGAELLVIQLQLLLDGVRAAVGEAHGANAGALLASHRFLRARFGTRSDELRL